VLDRHAVFEAYAPSSPPVIFLGDSMIQRFDLSCFNDARVLNFGINGDHTSTLLARLDAVARKSPEKIFLMIGTNDAVVGVPELETHANLRAIINRLRRDSPGARLFVHSVLPTAGVSGAFTSNDDILRRISSLNRHAAELCVGVDAEFVDMVPSFRTEEGELRPDLTTDGVHLNAEGYAVWHSLIGARVAASANGE
jgi:lysophospholipase L1-like esterase